MSVSNTSQGVNYSHAAHDTVTGYMLRLSKMQEVRAKSAGTKKYQSHTKYETGVFRNIPVVVDRGIPSKLPIVVSALNGCTDKKLKQDISFLGFHPSGTLGPVATDYATAAVAVSGIHPVIRNGDFHIRAGDAVGILVDLKEEEVAYSQSVARKFDQPPGVTNTNFEGAVFPVVAPMHVVLQRELMEDKDFYEAVLNIAAAFTEKKEPYIKLDSKGFNELQQIRNNSHFLRGMELLFSCIQRVSSDHYVGKVVSSPTAKDSSFSVVC